MGSMVCEDSTTQTTQTGDVYKRKSEVLEFIKAAERGMRELPTMRGNDV